MAQDFKQDELDQFIKDGWSYPLPGSGSGGANGLSAYQIALKHGFNGSESAWLNSLKGTSVDPLANKNIVFIGDSIILGKGNIEQTDGLGKLTSGFQYCVKQKHPDAKVYNFASDGAILTSAYRNVFESTFGYTMKSIISELDLMDKQGVVPDYIVMDGGSNDINNLFSLNMTDKIGSISSYENRYHSITDGSTVYGALEDIFIRIRTKYPNCKIIYLSFMESSIEGLKMVYGNNMTDELITAIQMVFEEVKTRFTDIYQICRNYKCQFINLYISSPDTYTAENARLYTIDGSHPTLAGYQYMYPIIDDALINMRNDQYL